MKVYKTKILKQIITALGVVICINAAAQTDMDAIMMEKNALCVGPMYGYSSWKSYWEGTLKRENLNLGTVSTQSFGVMGAYGLNRKLNLLFSVPYLKTKASAGTLHGMEGFQDLSLFAKWKAVEKKIDDTRVSIFGTVGASIPLSNYVADFLPLSIGMRSKTAIGRVMADVEHNHLFATASATYVLRDNIKIDRTSYYTTEMHYSNEVEMPDGANYNFRAGWRSQGLIAEAIFNRWTTLGGFDITRNNMPFPSNRMNASTLGVNIKYVIPSLPKLSVVVGGNHVVAGRNVGQSTGGYGSLFYVLDLSKKTSTASTGTITN